MHCRQARPLLSPFHDGELARADADAVRAHLLDCQRCRAEASEMRRYARLLDPEEPVPALSAGFTDAVFGRIRSGEGLAEKRVQRASTQIVWAAAAVTLLSVGVLFAPAFVTRLGRSTLDAATTREVEDEIRRNDRLAGARPANETPRPSARREPASPKVDRNGAPRGTHARGGATGSSPRPR